MAIEIREVFQVRAPIDTVWRFVMDPHKVVTCMPGAALDQIVDDRTFLGSVKIKVGAITASYKGKVQFTSVDPQAYVVQMLAEGRDTGGGTAKGSMSSRLRTLPDGQTEVVAEASVDLTGKIVQVGRGMIQGVSHQLFQQFIAAARAQLEAATPGAEASPDGNAAPAATPAAQAPIRILPIVFKVIRDGIRNFFRRLFGRPPQR